MCSLERAELANCKKLTAFSIDDAIANGSFGTVIRVRCKKPGFPHPRKYYALKACFNHYALSRASKIDRLMNNECRQLKALPPHSCIVTMYTDFVDTINEEVLQCLPPDMRALAWSENARTGVRSLVLSQFYLTSFHSRDLNMAIHDFPPGSAIPERFVLSVLLDIGDALLHCYKHRVIHMDVKPENVLIDGPNAAPHAILCDFGCAIRLADDSLTEKTARDVSNRPEGNEAYRAPELRNSMEEQKPLSFAMQPSFELGVLGYDILTCEHPVSFYRASNPPISYEEDDISELTEEWCENEALRTLLKELVLFEPERRMPLSDAVDQLQRLFER